MADPYLSPDETVILATDKVEFRGLFLSALVLTEKRILMIIAQGDSISGEEIPLPRLRSANVDTRVVNKPVLALSYVTEHGSTRNESITFLETGGKPRVVECRLWAEKLRGMIEPSPKDAAKEAEQPVQAPVMKEKPAPAQKAEPVPATVEKPASPDSSGGFLAKHDRPSGLSFPSVPDVPEGDLPAKPVSPRGRSMRWAAVIGIAIIALLVIAVVFTFVLPGKTSAPPAPAVVPTAAATAAATTSATAQPTPAETPVPEVTLSPPAETLPAAPSAPAELVVPDTGVWVSVKYPGSFNGTVGIDGALREVSGTGSGLYQIVTSGSVAKAFIQKTDGSPERLVLMIYKDGVVIGSESTTSPVGEVNVQVLIKPPETTPAKATIATTTPAVTPPVVVANVTAAATSPQ